MKEENTEFLKGMLSVLGDNIVSPKKLKEIVSVLVKVVKDSKDSSEKVTQETRDVLKKAINYLDEEHAKLLNKVNSETETKLSSIEKKSLDILNKAEKALKEIKSIEVKDGKTPKKGEDYFTDSDKNEVIVETINRLKTKNKLSTSDIDGLEKLIKETGELGVKEAKGILALMPKNPPIYGGGSGATFLKSMRDLDLTGLSNGNVIKWDASKKKFVVGASGTGAVDSVNGKTGEVVLDADDISDTSTTHKFTNQTDINRLANTSGTNTGDQDLSGYALKNNVLALNNTTPFTPDADYEPATKKYVDDNGGSYTLPTASATTLGGVKVGTRLSIDGNGVLSADVQAGGGDVVGPASAVDSNFAVFDGITGKLIKDSGKKATDFMAAGSVTQYTDEMAQDAVGNAVGNGLDYDDSTGAISVDPTELTTLQPKLTCVYKTADYTANPFELVNCDVSAASFKVTLPSAPADKTVIHVKLNGIGANKYLTLATSGTDKFNTATGTVEIYMYLFGEFAQLQYCADTGIWTTFISAATYNFATQFPGVDATTPITNANIAIDTTALTLTITPPLGYFNIFVDGGGVITRYRKVGNIVFGDGSGTSGENTWTDTSGSWYFYFNNAGQPVTTQTPWTGADFSTSVPIYRIIWNATLTGAAKLVSQYAEYHENTISADDHTWKHVQGAIWANGFVMANNSLTSGVPNADGRNSVIALSTGTVIDDNLAYTITNDSTPTNPWQQDLGNTTPASLNATNSALFKIFTQNATSLISFIAASRFPFPYNVSNVPEFITSTGTRTAVTDKRFFVTFVYSTQNPTAGDALKVVSATQDFTSLALAQAYTWTNIQSTYLILNDGETRPLYRMIFEHRASYDVGAKYSVLREVQDIRKAAVTTTTVASGSIPATSVVVTPTGNIASTNAQSALEELDLEKLNLNQTSSQTIIGGQPIQDTLTASELVATDANKKLQSLAVSTYPSLAELAHVKGVTSGIQSQLNSKGAGDMMASTYDPAGGARQVAFSSGIFEIATVSVNNGGTGYTVGDNLILTSGAQGAYVTVDSETGGVITAVILQNSGYGAIVGTATVSGGTGSNAIINIDSVTEIGYVPIKGITTDFNMNGSQITNAGYSVDSGNNITFNDDEFGTTNYFSLGASEINKLDLYKSGTAYAGQLDFSGITTPKVFTFPDATGTLALTSDIPDISGLVTTDQTTGQSIGDTTSRLTKLWATDIESTNMPTVGGTPILSSLTAPQFTTIELGHATDTTLSRVSAGVIAVEGKTILTTDGGTLTGNIQLGENTSIDLDGAGSADGKYSGIAIAGVAGAALSFGQLVYLAAADSRWELTDADSTTTGYGLVGMCVLAAAGDGSATKILLQGQIRADAQFPALTIGAPVYLGETAGAIQTTIPTGADNVLRVVGFALTADEIYFNPSQDVQTTVA